jgi:hypothetical protein
MSLAYPVVVSTLPFKDVSARALADLAPPTILWTRAAIGSDGDEHVVEDVRHDDELPSYGNLIPTSRPLINTTINTAAIISPDSSNDPSSPPTPHSISSAAFNLSVTPANSFEDGVVRAMRSVRSIMTHDSQGVGLALAKLFP